MKYSYILNKIRKVINGCNDEQYTMAEKYCKLLISKYINNSNPNDTCFDIIQLEHEIKVLNYKRLTKKNPWIPVQYVIENYVHMDLLL